MIEEISSLNSSLYLTGRSQEIALFLQALPIVIASVILLGLHDLNEADARAGAASPSVGAVFDEAA